MAIYFILSMIINIKYTNSLRKSACKTFSLKMCKFEVEKLQISQVGLCL